MKFVYRGLSTFFYNNIYENLMMGMATIFANKLRSILTVLGVIIGVITVMLISSIISGIDVTVTREVEAYGTRSIYITKFAPGVVMTNPTREERMRKPLQYDDAIALSTLPTVELAVPLIDVSSNYFGQKINVTGPNGKTSANVGLTGTLPDYERIGTEIVTEGRWFTQSENDNNQQVCVVGPSVADGFFKTASPVGETLEIGGREFRVVGVLQKREQFLIQGDDINNNIYMPYDVARKLKPNSEDIFLVAVARPGMMNQAKDQVTDMLRVRRRVSFGQPNSFAITTAESYIEQFRSITQGVAIAMVVISSVGLMVGGIGVMNIMLVSVTERTREIGIRKAIGARKRDILIQFLIEAMTLTGFGGLLGLGIGWLLTFLVQLFLPSYVPLWAPAAGFIASVSIGLFFGLFPAWKAARLDPIEALRYE